MLTPTPWDEATYGPLSEAGLRARYGGSDAFHVVPQKFPAGARFAGSAKAGLCFVLRGVARYRFQDVVMLQSGEYAQLPEGEYRFRVVGPEVCELVRVYEVPRGVPTGPIRLPPPPR